MRLFGTAFHKSALALDWFRPIVEPLLILGLRLWIASFLWKKGLEYVSNHAASQSLFERDYRLPLLSPDGWLSYATFVSLVTAISFTTGFGTRFMAVLLLILTVTMHVNVEATPANLLVISLCLYLMVRGASLYSWDYYLRSNYYEDAEDVSDYLHGISFFVTLLLTLLALYEIALAGLNMGASSLIKHFS